MMVVVTWSVQKTAKINKKGQKSMEKWDKIKKFNEKCRNLTSKQK